ncbi:DUF6671 family protein [Paracoccus alkanivorans]|uniref:DUF6671 domain-containing protein n=1 Tax=Paracoccus alkanivorans TaxID=2116655 RepID=A0A3M0LYA3_9RHOB|nr:DUF6671 family protein [Paracoccus alkanivorans]RMC29973.1 hypothetical protein C9E81_22210 [Paracoccus alkanivorans]
MKADAAETLSLGSNGPYRGRCAVLATMHGKEATIAPPFAERLGLSVEIPPGLDTDSLGTFSGEIARTGTIEEAAIAKARLGMAVTGVTLAIASEGSYGPHPQIPFIAAGFELMVLVDDDRGIVIREHLIDESPTYEHANAESVRELDGFLSRIGFPDHAVIVRPNGPDGSAPPIHKGIRSSADLQTAIEDCATRSDDGRAFVQTDMRAHMNRTRMATLGRLAERLAARISCLCPTCRTPGYGLTGVDKGLPCSWCGGPSILVRHQILGCVSCNHVERRARPDGLTHADPGQCPTCNP